MDKKKNPKNLLLFLGSHISILLMGFVVGVGINFTVGQQSNQHDIIVQMQIDYGDGSLQLLPEDIVPAGTGLNKYIELSSQRHGVPFDIRNVNELLYVEAIHGVHSTQEKPWVYGLEGNTDSQRNIDSYRLKDGDIISWSR